MTSEQHRSAVAARHFVHFAQAFLLEVGIPDREYLIHNQNFGFEVGSDSESQAHIHARRVALDRRIEELLDLGKTYDFIEFLAYLGSSHPENGAVQIYVLTPGQLWVKPSTDL